MNILNKCASLRVGTIHRHPLAASEEGRLFWEITELWPELRPYASLFLSLHLHPSDADWCPTVSVSSTMRRKAHKQSKLLGNAEHVLHRSDHFTPLAYYSSGATSPATGRGTTRGLRETSQWAASPATKVIQLTGNYSLVVHCSLVLLPSR